MLAQKVEDAVSDQFQGVVSLGIRDSIPDWAPFDAPRPAAGAPSVAFIVQDDVGFAAMRSYGGPPRLQLHGDRRAEGRSGP